LLLWDSLIIFFCFEHQNSLVPSAFLIKILLVFFMSSTHTTFQNFSIVVMLPEITNCNDPHHAVLYNPQSLPPSVPNISFSILFSGVLGLCFPIMSKINTKSLPNVIVLTFCWKCQLLSLCERILLMWNSVMVMFNIYMVRNMIVMFSVSAN